MSEASAPPSSTPSTATATPAFKARLEVREKQLGVACSICGAWSPGLLVSGVIHAEGCTRIGESAAEKLANDTKEQALAAKPTRRVRRSA